MRSVELRKKRAAKIEQAGVLLTRAKEANRSLDKSERKMFEEFHDDADALMVSVQAEELQESRERELAEIRGSNGAGQVIAGTTELPSDCILDESETYTSRAIREHGEDDCRFGALLKLKCGVPVPDVRESETRAASTAEGGHGGWLVSEVTSGEILDLMRKRNPLFGFGMQAGVLPSEGAEFLYPRLSTEPTPVWVGENETLSSADAVFAADRIEPKILAVPVSKVPIKLIEQGPADLVKRFIIQIMASKLNEGLIDGALFGLGTAKQPLGLANRAINSHSMGTNGAAIADYDPFLDAIKLIDDDNGAEPTGAIMAPRTAVTIAKIKTGLASDLTSLLPPPRIANLPMATSNFMPIDEVQGSASDASRVLIGNWPSMTLFLQGRIRVLVLTERFADALQVGIISFLMADVKVDQLNNFTEIRGIVP